MFRKSQIVTNFFSPSEKLEVFKQKLGVNYFYLVAKLLSRTTSRRLRRRYVLRVAPPPAVAAAANAARCRCERDECSRGRRRLEAGADRGQ